MADKPKCSVCNERDATHKGLCSGCYGKEWRKKRNIEREAEKVEVKQLTSGVTEGELEAIQGEIVHDGPPETHLVATSPAEMAASREDMKAWLESRLTVIERDIVEANAALNEARRNGWATAALTSARNRAVDEETFYNKILMAVEAGHTIIPDFPIQIFAVRRGKPDTRASQTFIGSVQGKDTFIGEPVDADCAPAGVGEYRNPQRQVWDRTWENKAPGAQERNEPRYYTQASHSGYPAGPISFPSMTARSPIMRATAAAMKDKVFDQIGVCHPSITVGTERRVDTFTGRAGDPIVIGQILRKKIGSKQKCVSFIIAWYLNLDEL
jgi:hypothetical protein